MKTSMLREVLEAIEEDPEIFNQSNWGENDPHAEDDPGRCETPCCIAGLVARIGGGMCSDGPTIRREAALLLDLTNEEADRLFSEAWPIRWFRRAGVEIEDHGDCTGSRVLPEALEAIPVLRGMLEEGQVWQ